MPASGVQFNNNKHPKEEVLTSDLESFHLFSKHLNLHK